MIYIRARGWRLSAGLAVGVCLAIGSLTVGAAMAEPGWPQGRVAPVSESLADLLAGKPANVPALVMVHGTDLAAANRAVSETGMTKLTEFRKVGIVVARATPRQVEQARSQPGVTYLEGDQPVKLFTDTSHYATRGAQAARTLTGANGKLLDGSGVSVAVIDTGIDPSHPSLSGGKVVNNLRCGPLVMGCTAVGNHTPSDLELVGHGTAVSAVAVGNPVTLPDGRRISGAAPGAKLVSLTLQGGVFTEAAGNTALNWVLEHHTEPCGAGVSPKECPPIKVTNNSYGPPRGGGNFDPMSATAKLQEALVDEGVMTVWSNGKDDGDGTVNNSNPPGQDPTPGIVLVAAAAVGDDPTRAHVANFSGRGLASDPATWPDISAPGERILTACRAFFVVDRCGAGPLALPGPGGGNFQEVSGTSFAAPDVSGIIAQLFQLRPDASPGEVEDAMKGTAFKYEGASVPYVRVGEYTSSFDKGTGLVNVLGAAWVLDHRKSHDRMKPNGVRSGRSRSSANS